MNNINLIVINDIFKVLYGFKRCDAEAIMVGYC